MTDNWKNSAACASIGGDVWFPEAAKSPRDAIRICNTCLVKTMCLVAGMEETAGIWGGTLPAERARMRDEPTSNRKAWPSLIVSMNARGLPAKEIAAHIGCNERTVFRVLKAEREKTA